MMAACSSTVTSLVMVGPSSVDAPRSRCSDARFGVRSTSDRGRRRLPPPRPTPAAPPTPSALGRAAPSTAARPSRLLAAGSLDLAPWPARPAPAPVATLDLRPRRHRAAPGPAPAPRPACGRTGPSAGSSTISNSASRSSTPELIEGGLLRVVDGAPGRLDPLHRRYFRRFFLRAAADRLPDGVVRPPLPLAGGGFPVLGPALVGASCRPTRSSPASPCRSAAARRRRACAGRSPSRLRRFFFFVLGFSMLLLEQLAWPRACCRSSARSAPAGRPGRGSTRRSR